MSWFTKILAGLLILTLASCAVQGARLGHAKGDLAQVREGRDAWKATAGRNQALAVAWARSAGKSEGLRVRELATAVAAVNSGERACASRVAAARRSAAAIATLISKEPRRDPQGCPLRELLDAGSLRNATRPPADG